MTTQNFGFLLAAPGKCLSSQEYNDVLNTVDHLLYEIIKHLGANGVVRGWHIEPYKTLEVSPGEGWIGNAKCRSVYPQMIEQITPGTLNYIYAVKYPAGGDRVSESYTQGAVRFEAATTIVNAYHMCMVAAGVVDESGKYFVSVDNNPAWRVDLLPIRDELARALKESVANHIVSGFEVTKNPGLSVTVSPGVAYVGGYRLSKDAEDTLELPQHTWACISLHTDGFITTVTAPAIAALPQATDDALRLAVVETGAHGVLNIYPVRYTSDGSVYITVEDTGEAHNTFTVVHALGKIPLGYLVVRSNKPVMVYDSGSPWTPYDMTLKCNEAHANLTLKVW